ncbi:hypothetical protein [Moritella sp.]|nr:hypothetical protein [Moritella sp.]
MQAEYENASVRACKPPTDDKVEVVAYGGAASRSELQCNSMR